MAYTLSVAEAPSQLSELVHRLRPSDSVVSVDHGVPIAKLSAFIPILPQANNSAMTLREEWLHLFEEIRALSQSADITDEAEYHTKIFYSGTGIPACESFQQSTQTGMSVPLLFLGCLKLLYGTQQTKIFERR